MAKIRKQKDSPFFLHKCFGLYFLGQIQFFVILLEGTVSGLELRDINENIAYEFEYSNTT